MGLECKSRKSRNTWSKGQIWPWSTEWSRAKANRVLPRERTGHSKHCLPTRQEKTLHLDITRWSTPKSDWLYSLQPKMEKIYTVSKNKPGSWLWLRSWTPYCQIQTYIEKEGKTTRPFRYDHTVEVRNRFKRLHLIEYLMNYEWRFLTLYRRQGARPSQEKEMQNSKMSVCRGLTNSCEKKRSKKQRRKGKI